MPTRLANKIAAGEVIENLASVIKELIENSIDAQATKIDISLIDSGMQLMQVSDNGLGMSSADLALSIKEHASSKLTNEYDLFNINSLGFRGEALASIAAVAHLEIASNDGHDSCLLKDGHITPVSLNRGTRVVVNNIFYNVPARLKHLKSQNRELSNIVELVHKFAMGYPKIAFTLSNDQQMILQTNGKGDTLNIISDVYGLATAQQMEPFSFNNADFSGAGYLSTNQITRGNKKAINIYVNHRLVNNPELITSIIEGYDDYLMERRFPIVVLNINCDNQLVDVNVHPAKKEVRLSNKDDLLNLIIKAIQEHFQLKVAVSKMVDIPVKQTNLVFEQYQPTQVEPAILAETTNSTEVPQSEYQIIPETSNSIIEVAPTYLELDIIGQFNATYILAQSQKGLHLIDQHAAMERINYEQMLAAFNQQAYQEQDLLVPIIVPLTMEEKMQLLEKHDALQQLNLSYEEQANHDLLIRSIPWWIKPENVQEVIENIINYLIADQTVSKTHINKEQLILAACKTSLKANHRLNIAQQKQLVDDLMQTSNYDRCPHGRPIMITYSPYEVDKMFKRII